MNLHSFSIAALFAASVALTAAAQETPAPATPQPEAAATPSAEATPAAPAEPAAPAPVPPAAQTEQDKNFPVAQQEQPTETLREKFESWEVRCSVADPEQCFLYQIIRDATGEPIAEFTMIRLPAGGQAQAGATLVTPLGVLLGKGVGLTIDTGQPLAYPYLYCARAGCFARLGLTDATVTRMKKGAVAKFIIYGVNAPDKAVEGSLSLKGFTAAFDSLKK